MPEDTPLEPTMFAESMLETAWAERARRSWTTFTSFGLQALIIGLLLLLQAAAADLFGVTDKAVHSPFPGVLRGQDFGGRQHRHLVAVEDYRSAVGPYPFNAHSPGKGCGRAIRASRAAPTRFRDSTQFPLRSVDATVAHSDCDRNDSRRIFTAGNSRSRHGARRCRTSGGVKRLASVSVQRKQTDAAARSCACRPHVPHFDYARGKPDSPRTARLPSAGQECPHPGIGDFIRGDRQGRQHRPPARSLRTSTARACGDRGSPSMALPSLCSQ